MKKNELVHVHALLAAVAERYLERGVVDSTAFDEYRALNVTPLSLRAPRPSHERAVLALAAALGEGSEAALARPPDGERGGDDLDGDRESSREHEPGIVR